MILIILKRLNHMPILWNCVKGTLVIFLLLSASLFFILKAPYKKQLQFQGNRILVKRNEYGIPHLKAPNFPTMMYGWGYVTAEDRIFQMAFKRLVGHGELSKYLGQKTLKVDKMFRQLGFRYWADKTAEKLKRQNTTQYQNFANYVKGINSYMQNLNFLPIEFTLIGLQWEPWTVSDVFLLFKLLVWSQSQNMADQYIRSSLLTNYTISQINDFIAVNQEGWQWMKFNSIVEDTQISEELLNLNIPLQGKESRSPNQIFKPEKLQTLVDLGIMNYLDYSRGSNSWVISGNHTKSGLPLVANDPHLDNAIPSQWHQIKIQYIHQGKAVSWQGGAMTGIPAMVGKTQYLSFALTTIYADSQDLYSETIDGDSYLLNGEKMKLKIRMEEIQIKGTDEVLNYQVRQTHRGPIINYINHFGALYDLTQKKCESLSLAWSGYHNEYDSLVAISHVAQIQNYQTMRQFLNHKTDHGPNMNMVYATVDGHIGYTAIGHLPIRKNAQSGNFVKDGSNTENDWIDLIKGKAKLHIQNPSKGYIVTANNKPVSAKYQNGIYESSMYTARANRITQMIEEKINQKHKFSSEDMKKMQLDTVDVICRQNMPYLLKKLPPSSLQFELDKFNCDFTKSSYHATIYQVFLHQLYLLINPIPHNQFNLMSGNGFLAYIHKYIRGPTDQLKNSTIQRAFQNTIQNLTSFFKTQKKEEWKWQIYHLDINSHRPFSGSDVLRHFYQKKSGGRGNINTVNVGKMNKLSYGDFTANHRANIRTILSHSKDNQETKSYWIVDTGVSEKFHSKHYDDQHKLFVKDQYLELYFDDFDEQSHEETKRTEEL